MDLKEASKEKEKTYELLIKVELPEKIAIAGVEIVPVVRPEVEAPRGVNYAWYKVGATQSGKPVNDEVGNSKTYTPKDEDIGFSLKVECVVVDKENGTTLSKIEEAITDPVISFPRAQRQMILLGSQFAGGFSFTLLSYNILADMYPKTDLERYCKSDKWCLNWHYRKKSLLKEITEYNPDIVCLQEVQSNHFESVFEPEMKKLGYVACYKRKTDKGLFIGEYVNDGCATFYRRDLFEEVTEAHCVEYKNTASVMVDTLIEPFKKRDAEVRLAKDNVALVVVLKPRNLDFNFRICVANTHIHAQINHPDVKLLQVATLVEKLQTFLQTFFQEQIPVLICADLNSIPGSYPHTLLTKGQITSAPQGGSSDNPYYIERFINWTSPFFMKSAYVSFVRPGIDRKHLDKMDPHSFEPKFTRFSPTRPNTLDYIFYSADRLYVEGLLELPGKDLLEDNERFYLPSRYWSSDHVALMARFTFLPPYNTPPPPVFFYIPAGPLVFYPHLGYWPEFYYQWQ